MEPSSTDDLKVELFRCLRAARREETFLSLNTLAEYLDEMLDPGEHVLLADLLIAYEEARCTPAVAA